MGLNLKIDTLLACSRQSFRNHAARRTAQNPDAGPICDIKGTVNPSSVNVLRALSAKDKGGKTS
jgi:hypothetical protein